MHTAPVRINNDGKWMIFCLFFSQHATQPNKWNSQQQVLFLSLPSRISTCHSSPADLCMYLCMHYVTDSYWSGMLVTAPGALLCINASKLQMQSCMNEQHKGSTHCLKIAQNATLLRKPICSSTWSVVTFCLLVPLVFVSPVMRLGDKNICVPARPS